MMYTYWVWYGSNLVVEGVRMEEDCVVRLCPVTFLWFASSLPVPNTLSKHTV